MPPTSFLLGERAAEQIAETVRHFAGSFRNQPDTKGHSIYPGGDTAIIRVTGTKRCGNFHPAVVVLYDRHTHTWTDLARCWAMGPNDECLTVGKRYGARRTSISLTTTSSSSTTSSTSTTHCTSTTSSTTTTSAGTTTTSSSTTSTTTTYCPTLDPEALIFTVLGELSSASCDAGTTTTYSPCFGRCRWTWDNTAKTWTLTSNTCCPTGPDGCSCVPPRYCGGLCGVTTDETVTTCAKAVPHGQPFCGTTTTTASGTTTTTSATTSTSTTFSPACTRCVWRVSFGQWVLVTNGCLDSSCPTCSSPSIPATNQCDTTETGCTGLPGPPPPPPPPPCFGSCQWICDFFGWVNTRYGCSSTSACQCEAPSFPCVTCGDQFSSLCGVPNPPPTTTGTTGTTGQPTTTTLTTSTTFTTTSTSCPTCCDGTCRWQWNVTNTVWVLICSNCPVVCTCKIKPPYAGTSNNQTAETPCESTTSTTTTSTSTTSSTTTSTTTTLCGGCTLEWNGTFWFVITNACTGACICNAPTVGGGAPGTQITVGCGLATTTTQTSTTSSTSTTCTTTPGPAITCGVCYWLCTSNRWIVWVNHCDGSCACANTPPDCLCRPPYGTIIFTSCAVVTTTTAGP